MAEQLDLFAEPSGLTDLTDLPAPGDNAADEDDHRTPHDQAARDRIVDDLGNTLFVEAGAGSGKTTALTDRVVQLVLSGVEMHHIAAITFTEKAALELRDRIRHKLETHAHEAHDPATVERCSAALDQVDAAAISTLHAFAQRVLSEHPVEAGLPPSIEVLDEISSQVAFDNRWRTFLDGLLDDPEHADLLLLADTLGVKLDEHLRDVAEAFLDNWDLVAERVADAPAPGRPRVESILDLVGSVLDMAAECTDADDKLLPVIENLADWGRSLEAADDWLDTVALLRFHGVTGTNKGRAGNWPDVGSVRDTIKVALAEADAEVARLVDATIKRLANLIREFTIEHVEERRTAGRLEFHDLLVLARQLLRDPVQGPQVRPQLRQRYQRLLLDEFQDTDPIQIELAVLIASDDPDAGAKPWNGIDVEPGRLFFVGDPKQSIYRFRRADVALFLAARETFAGDPVRLDTNFRTVPAVIDWVNRIFSQLIVGEADRQPEYQPLQTWRQALDGQPAVTVLGTHPHEGFTAEELRRAEAEDVAAVARTALEHGWPVGTENGSRPCEPGDITILLPARTSLPALERALEAEGLDYRAETSSLVWSTTEIRELMAVLRAVDDPTDELSIATALRSAIYGCGDDDLYHHRRAGGRWNHQDPLPDSLAPDHPVAVAMTHLRSLHSARMWSTPSALVERIIRERRLLELGVARGRPRDVWRRLRFVQDQARAYVDSEGGGLRQFLAWAALQSADGSRVAETLLPETDADAIRIMTIHASKGLEFPITILSGLTTKGGNRRRGVQVAFPNGEDAVIKMGKDLATDNYDDFKPIDEKMDHLERLRLLYVAATRARDHLVVSLHRPEINPDKPPAEHTKSAAQLLQPAVALAQLDVRDFHRPVLTSPGASSPATQPSRGRLDRGSWEQQRAAALTRSAASTTIAATTVAARAVASPASTQLPAGSATPTAPARPSDDPGLQKDPRDLDLPPWNKGRYGTAIGRAVHAVLQTIDLESATDLDTIVAAQAAAEAVIGHEDTIADLVRAALDSSVVREAVALPHWRETYVAAPLRDQLAIEGYIDLLYRRADGLVIVDYKTDAVDEAELARRMDKYALQGASYALALEEATGENVADVLFLFLRPNGSTIVAVDDIEAAVARVRSVTDTTG